jgi:hypothetical protein
MTTQDFIDWAFAQQGLKPPYEKLALIALALKANPEGGGKVTLGYLAQGMSCPPAEVVGHLAALVRRRLIVFTYRPSPSLDDASEDEIEFGLFLDNSPAS